MKKSKSKPAKAEHKGARKRIIANRILTGIIVIELGALVYFGGTYLWQHYRPKPKKPVPIPARIKPSAPSYGNIVSSEKPISYTASQTVALIKQTDKTFTLPVTAGFTKQTFSYISSDPRTNKELTVYGRVYVPATAGTSAAKLPLLAFAPGTTGLADTCAPSIEDPTKRNWANYDSLLAAYASQGYTVVTTDYAGLRDPNLTQPYMVGDSEARAVLDSIRAAKKLDLSRNLVDDTKIAVAGYSQGGHAAFWTDQLRGSYAPEIKLRGVVGFGPVTNVTQTLVDNVHGAAIDWFGPYLLVSYGDYYHQTLPIGDILQTRYANSLTADVLGSCIDTVSHYWPNVAAQVYTSNFVQALKTNSFTGSLTGFAADMQKNDVTASTQTPVLINQGQLDNVILPMQSSKFAAQLCVTNRNTSLHLYKSATHYNTMVTSFVDTLDWLNGTLQNTTVGNCGASG